MNNMITIYSYEANCVWVDVCVGTRKNDCVGLE